MTGKIKIGKNAHVKIKWKVEPIDYTREAEDNLCGEFAKKYGIDKKRITVEPSFIRKASDGSEIPYTTEEIEHIQEPSFQQELFKRYIKEKGLEGYNFDKVCEIDNIINSNINYTVYEKHKKYTVNWIKWSNFMSYGPDNFVDLTKLKGLVLLSSEPSNQGGKTTFCIDIFRFLLFGKVTSREDDWVLSKAFNKHIPEATEVVVEGSITVDGCEYIINRTLTRPDIKKRTDRSRVTQTIKYYKKVGDNIIDLQEDDENQSESSNVETNKAIKEAIGNERDFDLMICVNSDNLKGLISLKDTDRGRLISRWIGLLPLEEKDKVSREFFNKSVNPNFLMNKVSKDDLQTKKQEYIDTIANNTETIEKKEVSVKESTKKIEEYTQQKETLLLSKEKIDQNLLKVDIVTVNTSIERIINEGKIKKNEIDKHKKTLSEIGEVDFNEEAFNTKSKEREKLLILVDRGLGECRTLKNEIEALKKGEYCPTCGAKLKNVDNTERIKEKEVLYNKTVATGKSNRETLDRITAEVDGMKENQKKYNEKVKLQLTIDKVEVDIENLRAKLRENKRLLSDIENNKSAIEKNNRIDASLNTLKVNIETEEKIKERLQNDIISLKNTNENNNKLITECDRNIKIIEKEEVELRHWKLYLEMIGKNGISKMVLRNVLPLINGELSSILNNVCDFTVEVAIDDHNDVAFYLIHDGVASNLASGSGFEQTVASLALRSVLGKISTFSKPSFVVFDEILGGIADENYDNVKRLYDKIVSDYSFIMEICHLKQLTEWHNQFLTVKKEKNISRIETA